MTKERLKSPRARLFTALELPDPVRAALAEWQRRELIDGALRPVAHEHIHLTLVFLGYQRERDIDAIAEIVIGAGAGPVGVRIEPDPIGLGKTSSRPGVFALDAPSEDAVALQAELSDAFEAAELYTPERRSYRPHLTVARVRPEKRGSRRPRRVERPPGPFTGVHAFDSIRIHLYRSDLRPQGAEYASLATKELSSAKRGPGDEKVS